MIKLPNLKDGLVMKPQAWVLGTIVSAVTMVSYVHAFVYTRTEAEDLKKNLERVELKVERLERDIRDELRSINEWLRAESHKRRGELKSQ